MNARFVLLFGLPIAFTIFSCTKSGVGPSDLGGQNFSLTLTVVNGSGRPVGGLVVSTMQDIVVATSFNAIQAPRSLQKTMAVSTIQFEIPIVAHVVLRAYDLNESLVSTIVDLRVAPAGRHSAQFILMDQKGTQVYKCILLATDTASGATLYRDSIYAVLWQPDYALCTIGSTSSDGTFQSRDSLLFPNVLSLPPLILTGADGPAPLGTFQISDSVTVVLADTALRRTQTYACMIKRGHNNLHLTWNPGANATMSKREQSGTPHAFLRHREASSSAFEWKLEQNYPNPFL